MMPDVKLEMEKGSVNGLQCILFADVWKEIVIDERWS